MVIIIASIIGSVPFFSYKILAKERFENVEIRVIRPRYFTKRKKFEIGAQFSAIMNETFIYTFLGSGILSYHLTESIGAELSLSAATNIDKEDKRILFDEFKIKTNIFRTSSSIEAALLWTPIYGKWQLASGDLIYFDTFLSFGVGQTNIDWNYNDICTEPDGPADPPLPDNKVGRYLTILLGIGQRYFVSKKMAVRWDLRGHALQYEKSDPVCSDREAEAVSGQTAFHNNITLQIGVSRFL